MTIPRFSADANGTEVAAAITEQGCAVVERVVAPARMMKVREELEPYLAATQVGPDQFSGFRTRRTGRLIARSETCRSLIMNPLVLDTVGKVLAHGTSHHVHLTQVIAVGPGETAQMIHRDQWAFDFFPFPSGYEVQCNTIWAMTDFTEENGATRLYPGSNRLEDRLQLDGKDSEPAEMPCGSVLLYSGSLYHGAGANRSDQVRHGLNLTYALSWLRQEENQYLAVPAEVARELPEPLLRLMGYARGAYALGYVGDLEDPLDVLRGVSAPPSTGFGDVEQATRALRGDR